MSLLFEPDIIRAAGIDGNYRYWLTRVRDKSKPTVCWVMLNPSTADAEQDDPTIRRCMGFARSWGGGGISVVNLFAYRATDPKQLLSQPSLDRTLIECNNHAIQTAAFNCLTIAAWGCHKAIGTRDVEVMTVLKGQDVRCLGVTQEGYPKHPLYIASDTQPTIYKGRTPCATSTHRRASA